MMAVMAKTDIGHKSKSPGKVICAVKQRLVIKLYRLLLVASASAIGDQAYKTSIK